MIVDFETVELRDLYAVPENELRGKQKFPAQVIRKYRLCIDMLIAADRLDVLRNLRGLNLEHLKGKRKGQCSLRLNDQYRLIITPLSEDRVQIILINEISKHYE